MEVWEGRLLPQFRAQAFNQREQQVVGRLRSRHVKRERLDPGEFLQEARLPYPFGPENQQGFSLLGAGDQPVKFSRTPNRLHVRVVERGSELHSSIARLFSVPERNPPSQCADDFHSAGNLRAISQDTIENINGCSSSVACCPVACEERTADSL